MFREKLIYIEATGIQTQMYCRYARSKRGMRVNIRISGKCHARIGLVAAQCHGTQFLQKLVLSLNGQWDF